MRGDRISERTNASLFSRSAARVNAKASAVERETCA